MATPIPLEIAEQQHGLVTTEQLRSTGLTKKQISHLVTSGRLERVSTRLFRLLGSPRTDAQRLIAAVLDAGSGSALSHSTAVSWWGVPGFLLDDIHVTHARDGVHRPRRLATHVHDVMLLPEDHVRTLDGLRIVVPARAMFDLAGQPGVHPKRVERAVDNAWSRRLVSGRELHSMLCDLAKRGRPGIRTMREILRTRGNEYVPPASNLESRVVEILDQAGDPPLRRQVDSGDGHWIGRVDFADEIVPFRLEVQSERFHSSLLDAEADRERLARLRAAGFVVGTVTDDDVFYRPAEVVRAVREGRGAAGNRSRAGARPARGSIADRSWRECSEAIKPPAA